MGGKGGGGGGSQTTTQRIHIPGMLRPLIQQQAGTSATGLTNLTDILAPTVDGSTGATTTPQPSPQPTTSGGFQGIGGGITSGLFPNAGNMGLGNPLVRIGGVIDALGGMTGNQGQSGETVERRTATADELVAGFTPDQQAAIDLARQRAMGQGGFIPTAQSTMLEAAQGTGDSAGVQQLLDTASGQGITSEGFQGAFESALRDAQPEISSAFSLAGRSGSGLESTAQTQAAADAFANLFGQERQRQLRAGQTLAQRELSAAQQLPGLALADAGILQNIGQQQQQMEQQMIDAPIQAQQQLLQASGGPVPLGSLLGSSATQPLSSNTGAGILGGAATGLGIGSMMAPSGATGLAALGGPAGIGLGVGGALLGGLL